jgi:hypothetical protein
MPVNNSPLGSSKDKVAPVTSEDDLVNAGLATAAIVGLGVVILRSNLLPGMLLGVASMMAPRLFPNLEPALRPFIKDAIKVGYSAAGKAKEMAAEASEQFQDMVAEIRYEEELANKDGQRSN